MSQNKFREIQDSLLKEAMKAELKGDHKVLDKIDRAIEVNEKIAYKTQVTDLMKDLIKEANKYEIQGKSEKLAQVEKDIRYLQRDYEAFKDVNVFPEQEEGVTTMGYAKPDYNMGKEHTVNPMNVMDPEGKLRDMEQFPSGDDKRTKDLNKAKPRIPMAEDGKGESSISKVVENLETVKILDEKGMEGTPQKEQPAVPDSLPKLSSQKIYLAKIADKYEAVPKDEIIFPPTEDDEDGHFPIDTQKRARAALTYVNQYDSMPKWAKNRGIDSLEVLVKKAANAVADKYPDIDVSEEAKESQVNNDINQKIAKAIDKHIAKKAQNEDFDANPFRENDGQEDFGIDLHQGDSDIFGGNSIGQEVINQLQRERGESINILARAIEKYSEDVDNKPVVISLDNVATINRDYAKRAIDAIIDQMGVEETIVLRYIKTLL